MTIAGSIFTQAEGVLTFMTRALEVQYTGGTPFFDALDKSLRDPYWYRALLLRYYDCFPTAPRIVVSGAFGIGFAAWLAESEWGRYMPPPLVLPGDLRHGVLPPLVTYFPPGKQFAFLDDSYYKGRTYGQIKARIEERGGEVLGALVLYDGSPAPAVASSFFRYHP